MTNYYEIGNRIAERALGRRTLFPTLDAVCVYSGGNPDCQDDMDRALWLYGEVRRIGDAFLEGLLPLASAAEELAIEATGSRVHAREILAGYVEMRGV